jgi:hypothetical protein
VSRVGLGFSSTQNLGFFLEKQGEPLSLFFGVDFDGCRSVVCPEVARKTHRRDNFLVNGRQT